MDVYVGNMRVVGSDVQSMPTEKVMGVAELPPAKQMVAQALWPLEMPAAGGLKWAAFIGANGLPTVTVCADKQTVNTLVAEHKIDVDLTSCEAPEQIQQAVSAKLVEHWQEAGRQNAVKLAAAEQVISSLQNPKSEIVTHGLVGSKQVEEMAAILQRAFAGTGVTFTPQVDRNSFIKVCGPKARVETVMAMFKTLRPCY